MNTQELLAPKLAGLAAGLFSTLFIEGSPIPFFNVSGTTLGMAATGSLLAFAYGTPIKGYGKLYGYAVGGVFVGIWAIHLIRWQGTDVPEIVAGPLAGIIALISRWAIPAIVESVPAIWNMVVNRIMGGNISKGRGE